MHHLFIYCLSTGAVNGSSNSLPTCIAPVKVTSVIVLFVIFRSLFLVIVVQVGINRLPLSALVQWLILWLFILLFYNEGTVNKLVVVDCTLELTSHSSSDLFLVTELVFWLCWRPTASLNSNNNNNISRTACRKLKLSLSKIVKVVAN